MAMTMPWPIKNTGWWSLWAQHYDSAMSFMRVLTKCGICCKDAWDSRGIIVYNSRWCHQTNKEILQTWQPSTTVQVGEILLDYNFTFHANLRFAVMNWNSDHESWAKSLTMLTSSCSQLVAWGLLLMSWSPFSTARQAEEILVELKNRNPHVASCFTNMIIK